MASVNQQRVGGAREDRCDRWLPLPYRGWVGKERTGVIDGYHYPTEGGWGKRRQVW